MESGALLIDIRSESDRERDGIVPGSLSHPPHRARVARDLDRPWRSPPRMASTNRSSLLCDHGCSTILAAATLVELGYARGGRRDRGLRRLARRGRSSSPRTAAATARLPVWDECARAGRQRAVGPCEDRRATPLWSGSATRLRCSPTGWSVDVGIDVGLLKSEIKKTYASVSQEPEKDFIFPTGRAWAEDLGTRRS